MSFDDFMDMTSIRAMDAAVTYDGPMPTSPSIYYPLGHGQWREAFVYILTGTGARYLYVGKSRNIGSRFDKHKRQKAWWPEVVGLTVVRVEGETKHEAQSMAFFVEAKAIRHLKPVYNIAGVLR